MSGNSNNGKIYCDFCKKEINTKNNWAMILSNNAIMEKDSEGEYISIDGDIDEITFDYHNKCYEKLKNTINFTLQSKGSYNILVTEKSIQTYVLGNFSPLTKMYVIQSLDKLKTQLQKEIDDWQPKIEHCPEFKEFLEKHGK